jgi:putative ABC transport system permease protein
MKKKVKAIPPRWATKLLSWYCAPDMLEEIQGDLEEEFRHQLSKAGPFRAKFDYVRNVLEFIKPFAIVGRSSKSQPVFNMNMFQHYATVAGRNLIRHRSFSAINISGLALGLTCFLMILLWVRDEKQTDNFHAAGDRLFNLYYTFHNGGTVNGDGRIPFQWTGTNNSLSFPEDIKAEIPEVKYATFYATGYQLPWGHMETFQIGAKKFKFEGSRAGEDFFKMLDYPLVAGDQENALKNRSSLAISRKMAEMFFDKAEDAIGKSIRYENKLDFVITAVFEDVPSYSSLKFDFLINWEICRNFQIEFSDNQGNVFIQLQETANVKDTEAKLKHFLDRYIGPDAGYTVEIGLQPFGDQYLINRFVNGKPEGGRIEYVRIFTGVAFFILIIACINFMNLATARAVKRAREVGVRKVIGSSRVQLISQFFGESLLLSFIALVLSMGFIQLLLPHFNAFTGKQITSPMTEPASWIVLIMLVVATGVIAGSYPALFLSSLKPVRTLKGVMRFGSSAIWIRKGLAVFQFSLSIILLIATIVVSQQTSYVRNKHLGYDRENIIYIRVEGELNPKYAVFKEKALKMPGIAMVDRSSEAPHSMGFTADAMNWEGKPEDLHIGFKPTSVGFDFLKLMNLSLVEGRDFSKAYPTDTAAFMINETAVKHMGMKDPIGKWISAWDKKGHIIAVIKDYHTNSLHQPMQPLIVDVKEDLYFGVVMVRTEPGKTKEALASLSKVYAEINPDYPFAYQFLDQEYEKLYRSEQVMASLSNAFAILAILISCLGLLGLAMFSAEQRVKEIGIRKVLGATVTNIINLLSRDFLKIVFISFFIGSPVAWYLMRQWLQGFAFQIDLSWWIFALAGLSALLVALLTVSIQAVQSAIANPVDSLKSE